MFDGAFSPLHLLIIVLALLLLFGPSKLPALAKSVGQATKEFKKGIGGHDDEPAKPVEQ